MTIAQQLKVKEFPFRIRDSRGNQIYWEDSTGYWSKWEYGSNNKVIYCEYSDCFWAKWEYDANGKVIYYENSGGRIIDNRLKEVVLTQNQEIMTIAQQLNVKEFPFVIKDAKGNQIYWEYSTYPDQRAGSWYKWEYDSSGNLIYFETSSGFWVKYEYDSNGKRIYWEDSKGYIEDFRPKDIVLTIDEIAQRLNIPVSQLKIKK